MKALRWGVAGAGTICLWAVLVFHVMQTQRDTWFEDDPIIIARVADNPSPLGFLVDEPGLAGNEVVPLLFESFWLDWRVAPRDPRFAYVHSAVSLLLAALLLLVWLERRLNSLLGSVIATWVCLMLPASLATAEFLSTRCYTEGAVFALVSFLLADRAIEKGQRVPLVFSLLCMAAAILSKEFFVTTALLYLALRFWIAGRRDAVLGCIALGVSYLVYRACVVGISSSYGGIEFPSLREVARLATLLPLAVWHNKGAYVLAVVLFVAAMHVWLTRRDERNTMVVFGVCYASAVLTIVPVTLALLTQWFDVSTWSRTGFILSPMFVIAAVWLAQRLAEPSSEDQAALLPTQCVATSIFLGLVLLATTTVPRSVERWDDLKTPYKLEAEFLIERSGQLLNTQLPATWFHAGILRLYKKDHPAAFVSALTMTPEQIAKARAGVLGEWYRVNGQFEYRTFGPSNGAR